MTTSKWLSTILAAAVKEEQAVLWGGFLRSAGEKQN